jgi:hypothetical protein
MIIPCPSCAGSLFRLVHVLKIEELVPLLSFKTEAPVNMLDANFAEDTCTPEQKSRRVKNPSVLMMIVLGRLPKSTMLENESDTNEKDGSAIRRKLS